MSSDREFVGRLLAADPGAWQHWELSFRPVLARIARREFGLSPEDSDDVVQDLVVALLRDDGRQLRGYLGQASLRAWIYTVWRRLCLHSKQRGRLNALTEQLQVTPTSAEVGLLVWEALKLVSEHDRMLLEMYLIQGRTYVEIAARMGISVNSVGPSLARARRRLKKIINSPARKASSHATKRVESVRGSASHTREGTGG